MTPTDRDPPPARRAVNEIRALDEAYIDTYAWLDGRWQVVSAQITTLPEELP